MPFAFEILIHTPAWVFVLLAYLIWMGVKALSTQTVPIWRILIVPAVFVLMGLSRLARGYDDSAEPLEAWLAAAALFAVIGYATGPRHFIIDPLQNRVTRPGSPLPLIRNVLVFSLQYGVAVTTALHAHDYRIVLIAGRAVSGATAGYFIGWAVSFLRQYRAARRGVELGR